MTYTVSKKQITQTVAPAADPVLLAEMKHYMVVDSNDDDTVINTQIAAATLAVENRLNRSLVQRTYRADIPNFAGAIILPSTPLISVESIKYYSTDSPSVLTTLFDSSSSPQVTSDVFRVNTGQGYIYRSNGESWPSVDIRHDAVQITYVAGYEPFGSPEDHSGNVPEALLAGIKMTVADLYLNREATLFGRFVTLNETVKMLLHPYREY